MYYLTIIYKKQKQIHKITTVCRSAEQLKQEIEKGTQNPSPRGWSVTINQKTNETP